MAEFSEVMQQWGRYCKGYLRNHKDDCDGCPFEINNCCNIYVKDNAQHAEQIETLIMAWAAEYPERTYPAWRDWLRDLYGNPNMTMTDILESPIDPEIAQRLNIAPRRAR